MVTFGPWEPFQVGLWVFVMMFWDLFSSRIRWPRLILSTFGPRSEISHFSKESWFLLVGVCILGPKSMFYMSNFFKPLSHGKLTRNWLKFVAKAMALLHESMYMSPSGAPQGKKPGSHDLRPENDTCSLQFSHSVISNYLRLHGLQHTRLPCPSPTCRACSNWYPSSWWSHPNISSSVIPFSSCLQSFPASGPFLMSQFFTSGDQSVGVSASASVLPMNIQDWFPLGWTGWISLQSKGLSRVFSNTTVQKHQFFGAQLSL